MAFKKRIPWIVAAAVAVAAGLAMLAWLTSFRRPDPAAVLRDRLMGQSARDVESVLGQPAFRENDDRTWHYLGEARVRQFVGDVGPVGDLIVEMNADGTVARVYLDE